MRFRRLGLDAFGPFTGTCLDFTRAEGNGLHLIYGANEAGKSSALRAIRDLLFGIPQHTPDAHLHVASALRLSALIERGGEELAFVRRKKRKDSLSTPDDQPLPEARLGYFLNGLDAGSFERLFGLDYERLKEAGEQTLSGRGDAGEALFDAGASGRSVHRVKLALIEEAEALYKDRAQKPELNRLLSLYSEQKRRAKDSQHSPERYEEQQERVRQKRREAEQQRAELLRARAEREHVLRLKSVLSSVVERDRKLNQRSEIGAVPALPAGSAEMRERLLSELGEAERELVRLTRKLNEEQARLAALAEPGAIAGMPQAALRALSSGFGRAQKDIDDLPKRRGEARTLREAVAAKLPRLGLGTELESVLARSPSVADQARLRELGREWEALRLKLESAERDLPDAKAKVEALSSSRERLRAARRLQPDALLPRELCERFDTELGRAEEVLEQIASQQQENLRQSRRLRETLELLKGEHGVPSAQQLAEARAAREARLREAQELAADPKRKALELCLPLAALLQATLYADSVADRLRSDAQRVAEAEAIEQQLARGEAERLRLEEARQLAEQELTRLNERWTRTAESLGARAELLPREAARLLEEEREAWKELSRLDHELESSQAALRAALSRFETASAALSVWQAEWQAALSPLGLPASTRPKEVDAILVALSDLLAQHEKLGVAERRVAGIERDVQVFAEQVQEQARVFAPELGALSPPDAAERLLEQHRRATQLGEQRESVTAGLSRLRAERQEVEARHAERERALAELCRTAGATDVAQLAQLEERAARARQLDAEIAQLERHLSEVSEGGDIALLVEEARLSEKGAVASRLLELEDAISAMEEQGRELDRDVRELELGLRAYEGRDGADAAQELSATVAQMAEVASRFARVRLSISVLERVVEHYRERRQGPVLARASELFARLTLGRFTKLRVGLEELRLECVEAGSGKALELEHLSRGTRFQLFLALKLASLQQYLVATPPLPLVLDDVLVEWDDERSRACLQVLAEFSDHLQILLFTHHGRDVAAAEALGDRRVSVHLLGARAPGETVDPGAGLVQDSRHA